MKIVFRVDSSTQIGSGHLMRCLTLAERKRKKYQADVIFIMRDLEGDLIDLVEKKGFKSIMLPKSNVVYNLNGYEKWLTVPQNVDAEEVKKSLQDIGQVDLLVVDSYAIDINWETIARPFVKQIMVIDDLANRKHDCDVLLDQNFYLDKESRYNGLVPNYCRLCLGPEYALLREEFYEVKKNLRKRDGNIKNILVFFGGSDVTNETMKALKAIVMLDRNDITVNVIVGQSNQHKDVIASFCNNYGYMNYFCQVNNIAEFMNEADLSIGAGGTTNWERLFLELPSIVIAIAENQKEVCNALAINNKIKFLGDSKKVSSSIIYDTLIKYIREEMPKETDIMHVGDIYDI